ncbi:MAG: GNAT family N-acetyltransferase [Actinomycetia bacterium]|nr:GNAT family N-acetyltransferase [Actinomycetes bacterium]
MTHPIWPLFDLRVRTPRLELRYLDDELATELALLSAKGIHDPSTMPFGLPWSDVASPELERNAMQFYWRNRAETTPNSWSIGLATIVDGTVVGTTALETTNFPTLREFGTGSWLGREFQGKGIGKEMRVATLQLGFLGFGAEHATTSAWHDNEPSLGVTRSLGYSAVGVRRQLRRADSDTMHLFEMSRADFVARLQRDDITLHGVAGCLPLLGLDAPNNSQ